MTRAVWKPAVTVAAIIERAGRFLVVEERDGDSLVINQPAGHWEPGESLEEACAREALEESGCIFRATALVGVYRWSPPARGTTYLRFAFCGELIDLQADRLLDDPIERAVWLSAAELDGSRARHRSPLVMRCVEDYLSGRRIPLDVVAYLD